MSSLIAPVLLLCLLVGCARPTCYLPESDDPDSPGGDVACPVQP
jgi:hypothetical protein